MELELNGELVIAAVAQQPFKHKDNTFCKLVPLFKHRDKYDKHLDPILFPNDGEIWWRLSNSTNPRSISPGMMLELALEPSQEPSTDPDKSLYQAVFKGREEPIEASAGAEIFTLHRETYRTLQRLKGDGGTVHLPHKPSKLVFLKVEGYVYGPFNATPALLKEGSVAGDFSVRAARMVGARPEMCRMRMTDFASRYNIVRSEIEVALDQNGRRRSGNLLSVSYEYLPPEECEKIENDFLADWEKIDWEPLPVKFTRMASFVSGFSRSERQQLQFLVRKISESGNAVGLTEELKAAMESAVKMSEDEEQSLRDLAVALMESGLMSDNARFKKAMDEFLKNYKEDHRKELEAELEDLDKQCEETAKKVQEERTRLDRIREQRKQEEKKDKERLRKDLDRQREQARREIDSERKSWREEHEKKNAELDAKQKHVDAVLAEIKTRTEKSAADCLAMFPFLKEMGMGGSQKVTVESAEPSRSKMEPFVVPSSLDVESPAAKGGMTQNEFLARLRDYALSQGLGYDINDLRRFHVSVLCEGLSVLEGPSGVGKSSLARIYGDVLAGANGVAPRDGTHIVHVSPSWVERADLLGYVNTVTGEFSPSEAGLFQRLVLAEIDHARHGGASAMYPICLDEMNLAQVEHYFSDFLQILELPEERRVLRCFSKDAVGAGAVFRDHASIRLPPTVRFIGTVNFDETTKRLSPRLLDRVNLIYLNDNLRTRAKTPSGAVGAGKGVSAATYASWRRDGALSANVEKHLGNLAAPLRKLGVMVSPRVRTAMGRYIATAAPLIGTGEKAENIALDEQLAQRVLSKVRTITSLAQKKALDEIEAAVNVFRDESFSPSCAAIERLRAKEHFFGYETEV